MKKKIRIITSALVKRDFIWHMLFPIIRVSKHLQDHRRLVKNKKKTDEELKEIFKILNKPIVMNGPFKGLIYPNFTSFGSSIMPKIIGSYEKEISHIINEICRKNFTEIIDIGCAEGYYAVGLAKRISSAKIYAYDINAKARLFCQELASLNGVEKRIFINALCSNQTLQNFKFTGEGLIICDCEGCEKMLFNKENIDNLKNCEILVETHDFIDIEISTYLYNLFKETHQVIAIQSIDDIIKAKTYSFKEANNLNLNTKRRLFAEGRPAIMEWLYIVPRNQVNANKVRI